MISLKDYINESVLDDENVIMNKTIKSATKAKLAEVRDCDWLNYTSVRNAAQ